jgi:Flp pilus assembly protein TadG
VLFVLLIVVLMGLAALALDIGRAYGVKAKLNAAADVASVAAGRVVGQGQTYAQAQATNVFNANYPSGLLGSTVTSVNPTATQNGDGSWTILVTASATLPTSFAPVLPSGWLNFPINVSATCTVRTLDMVLVLDSSGSLTNPPTTPALLRSAATNFVGKFDPANDRVGLIHFGSGAVTDVTMTETKGYNLTNVQNAIGNINPLASADTASAEAMRLARLQLDNIPTGSQNSLRVIVFFTDGAPNTIGCNFGGNPGDLYSQIGNISETVAAQAMYATDQLLFQLADFNGTTLPDKDHTGTVNLQSDLIPQTRILTTNGSSIVNSQCNVNRAARSMLENVANAARSESPTPIRIFTIGLGLNLSPTNPEITNGSCGYGANESGDNILRRLANVQGVDTYNSSQLSGVYVWAQNNTQLNDAFQKVASQILRLSK